MKSPEGLFETELEEFRKDVESGMMFLYSFLTIHAVIGKNRKALDVINKTLAFWQTVLGALQTSYIIVLHRIFDHKSRHNIGTLIRTAEEHASIFSKDALAKRKRQLSSNADQWLTDYMKDVYVPSALDFQRMRKQIEKKRNVYTSKYRDIRNKIYAHKIVSEEKHVLKLFSKTQIRELEILYVFLHKIYEALWELYFNGRKPILRSMPYSFSRMVNMNLPKWQKKRVHQRVVEDTKILLGMLTGEA